MDKHSTFHQSLSVPFDHPVTSLSISPKGRDVVLAAKRGLYILDLENPFEPPRIFQHVSKWDVADVQWNPHVSRNCWIASTSNQKALVWNINRDLTSGTNSHVEFILAKHLRAISDIHWSPFSPETLATCSYDAYVYLWDLRQPPTHPSHSFCGWTAGATQVKFNRCNEYVLASAHDTDVRVWDMRKGSTPVTLITAHMTKIYGIDWSRTDEKELLTCSQDRLVKIWNTDQSRNCQSTIETSSPCWRARFTPFGNGIVTMPQRKDNSLYLWNRDMPQAPTYTFSGHSDVPTEFVWRYQREHANCSDNEYQLVTWSKDMHLRLWPISKETVKSVSTEDRSESQSFPLASDPINVGPGLKNQDFRTGSDPQLHLRNSHESPPKSENIFGPISLSSLSNVQSSHSDLVELDMSDEYNLEEELNRLQDIFPGVYIDKSNLIARRCTMRLERTDPGGMAIAAAKNILFQVDIIFPKRYPHTPPFFDIQKTWMLSMMNRTMLSRKLTQIAMTYAKKGKPCMEPAVRYLLGGNAPSEQSNIPIPSHSLSASPSSTSESSLEMATRSNHVAAETSIVNEGSIHDTTSTDEDDILMMGSHLKSFSKEKDNHNVPFPCLSGACFSQTGQLVYFTSPLPHPSSTKFTAYTFTTRNQQPILQSQSFLSQPKTYALYENYRSFVLARCPRMFLGGVPALQDRIQMPEDSQIKDRKLDYWLDDEDVEDDGPNLYWRPKPAPFVQAENFQTHDFLAKLNSFGSKAQSVPKDARRNSISSSIGPIERPPSRLLPNIVVNSGTSIPDASPISPISNIHPRRKSIGAIHSDSRLNSNSDLGIPFQEKSSPTMEPIDRQPLEMDMLGMIRKAKKMKRPVDMLTPIQTSISPHMESDEELDDSKYGTTVHVVDMEPLMPISRNLAELYQYCSLIIGSLDKTQRCFVITT
jgi:WD40 repeat protein